MSGRRKSLRSKRSLNHLFDEAKDSSTPRTLLLNALKEPEVQQTVKRPLTKRRSTAKNTVSTKKSQDSSVLLETSITPRTAIQNVMAANDVMATAARPTRLRRSPKSNLKVKKNIEIDKIYQPVVTQQELSKRLQAKLAGLKEATIRSEPPGSPDEHTSPPDDIEEKEDRSRQSPVKDASPREEAERLEEVSKEHSDLIMEDSSQSNDPVQLDEELKEPSPPKSTPATPSSIMPGDRSIQSSSFNQPNNSSPVASVLQNETIPASESELTAPGDPLRLNSLHQDQEAGEVVESDKDLEEEEEETAASYEDAHRVNPTSSFNRTQPLEPSTQRIAAPSLRRLNSSKVPQKRSSKTSQSSFISTTQLKGILEHHSSLKVTKEAMEAAEGIFASFFKRLCQDMEAVTQFAGRAIVNKDDLELIMKRQRFITKDKSLNMLIRENLPLEYQQLLIEEATSVLVPLKKKKKK